MRERFLRGGSSSQGKDKYKEVAGKDETLQNIISRLHKMEETLQNSNKNTTSDTGATGNSNADILISHSNTLRKSDMNNNANNSEQSEAANNVQKDAKEQKNSSNRRGVKTAASIFGKTESELVTQLEYSLKTLKEVIGESEKVAAQIENVLKNK